MSTPVNGEEKKYETIGKAICNISFWLFALKFIAVVSLISLVILFIIGKPLWIAPIVGVVLFLTYRAVTRFVLSKMIQYSSKSGDRDIRDKKGEK